MSHRSSSRANDFAIDSRRSPKYFSYLYPAIRTREGLVDRFRVRTQGEQQMKNSLEDGRGLDDLMDTQTTWIQRDYREIRVESRNAGVYPYPTKPLSGLVVGRYTNEGVLVIMAGRNTRSSSADNTNPPNETADEVTRQLNAALPNLLTQLVQALGGNRTNQREATPSCNIKTFRASGAKEFFGTEGAVGLLTWFESTESVLHITKCPAESQVEFAASMLQGRALTWWNTLVQTRGRAAAIAQPWEDFKKLLMKEYCPDDEIQKLESEFWNHKMVGSDIDGYTARFHELARLVPHMVTPESQRGAVSMANRLTTDGIKDGLFKKRENARNKRRSNDQNKNRGRGERNKRQRTGGNFALTIPEQGQRQRQYAGQHPKCAKCSFHHSGNCHEELPKDESSTSGGNQPNPVLAIVGNNNQGNNRNRAQGRAFSLGIAEAPQDLNVMTGTLSLNDHFATVLFDYGADYSFISTKFLPL
ncbi:putative reverse transcriptase domain-containing protein [Tanacetum coccineum]